MITTLLGVGLAIALAVLAASVTALLIDSRRVTRLERALVAAEKTIGVADRTIALVIAERDEARRGLREALAQQGEPYIRLQPRPGDVALNQYLPDWAISSNPQDRTTDGVPEVEQACPLDITQIVERNTWPKWPNQ